MAHILIVDDERDVATMVTFMLERDGHRVSLANDGQQALAMLGVEPRNPSAAVPDLILMDVMMPVLDGEEACRRLAVCDLPAAKVPIVVLTGRRETRAALSKLPNVAVFLEKPFGPAKLREAVADLLPPASPEVRSA